ncbi:SHOCT domain-containing protein [Clostridium beijerinckii]|nr:SHOCT domain-containing protein [Clostridium beijerinckii]
MGKNRKNINTIMSALSEELKNYVQVTKKSTSTESVADEIRKLAELKEQGILTEDEFSSKKKQLLGL